MEKPGPDNNAKRNQMRRMQLNANGGGLGISSACFGKLNEGTAGQKSRITAYATTCGVETGLESACVTRSACTGSVHPVFAAIPHGFLSATQHLQHAFADFAGGQNASAPGPASRPAITARITIKRPFMIG